MTEIYRDKCIDIFPEGRDYRCQFTSLADKTYLIRLPKAKAPSCCLWSEDGFHAPRPDVIRNMKFDKSLPLGGRKANAWVLDVPLPGPFGYAFSEHNDEPVTFWFPVISGWVQQNFKDFVAGEIDPKVFELPAECRAQPLPVCR